MFLIFCSTHDFANAAINSISLPSSVCVVLTCVQSENCQLLKGSRERREDELIRRFQFADVQLLIEELQ